MRDFWKKLKSRKFLTAMAGVIVGLCMAFGLDESTMSSVAGAVVSVASVVSYIMTEGKVDAAAVKKAVDDVQTAEQKVRE
jgi:ABC-type nickel/cobalt efflux system permease component RcnA